MLINRLANRIAYIWVTLTICQLKWHRSYSYYAMFLSVGRSFSRSVSSVGPRRSLDPVSLQYGPRPATLSDLHGPGLLSGPSQDTLSRPTVVQAGSRRKPRPPHKGASQRSRSTHINGEHRATPQHWALPRTAAKYRKFTRPTIHQETPTQPTNKQHPQNQRTRGHTEHTRDSSNTTITHALTHSRERNKPHKHTHGRQRNNYRRTPDTTNGKTARSIQPEHPVTDKKRKTQAPNTTNTDGRNHGEHSARNSARH